MTDGAERLVEPAGEEVAPRQWSVPAMSCQHCIDAITTEVGSLVGVDSVTVDLDAKTVSVVGDAAAEDVVAAIDEAGFDTA